MDEFDFVIVGAGTAGCCLAYRLAAAGHSVCVLEAGPADSNPYIRIPSGIMKISSNPRLTWRFETEPDLKTGNRRIPIFVGKVLGGSSSINGMAYNRGQRSDYDGWAAAGNPGWDYKSVLPYFKKSERYVSGGQDEFRGRSGPIPISLLESQDPISDLFIKGCVETGIPLTDDYNGQEQEGVSYLQGAIYKGRRWSSAHGYLHEAERRLGVNVRTNAFVSRVLVNGKRAFGVEYARSGSSDVKIVRSRISTIISAGAILSPALLQRSGIGSAEFLQQSDIPVVLNLPGVGENLSDHYSVRMVARIKDGLGTINERARGLPLVKEVARWMVGKPSVLAQQSMSVFTFCKLDRSLPDTEYSLMFLPAALKAGMTRRLDEFPGVTGGVWQQRPQSRGFVRIRSKNIENAPVIQPNYLDAEIDRQVLITAMKHLKAVFDSEAMRTIIKEITLPTKECRTDDEWLDYIRNFGMTSYHPAGTCKMGPSSDRMAVIDSRLRVHGLDGLHVIDASMMPTQVSGNLNAAVMMIAEKASDMILEDVQSTRLAS
jgi:choline dehydrogenase